MSLKKHLENMKFQVKTEELVTADYAGGGGWGDDDPSVFVMTIAGRLQGEFQVTNGYGPNKAPQIMRVRTYITYNLNSFQIKMLQRCDFCDICFRSIGAHS